MWSSDRRSFLTLAALAGLAACGFTPAYAPGGGAQALTGRIALPDPVTPDDYILVREMEQRLGRASGPYALEMAPRVMEERMAVTANNIVTRFNVVGEVAWTLKDAAGRTLATGTENSFTAYSATGSTVATQAARRDARERLMRILADQLVTRLIAAAPALTGSTG